MYSSIPSVIQNDLLQKEGLQDEDYYMNNNNNNNNNAIRQNNFFQAAPSYLNNYNNVKNNLKKTQRQEERKIPNKNTALPQELEQVQRPSYINNNNINNNNKNAQPTYPFGRPTAVLFVGQINYEASENDVRFLFSFYGDVLRVVLFKSNSNNNNHNNNNEVDKTSAFVTYGSTAEADMAILSLHNRYCMDARERPLQVSYCLKTDVISEFGYRHALQLHKENPANPMPSFPSEKIIRNNNNNNNNNEQQEELEGEDLPLFTNELGEVIDTAVYYC